MEPKRLNKFISDTGFCSRREADTLLEQGRVTVNGKTPEPGMKVTPKDKVKIDDEILRVREEKLVCLVLNKPAHMSATSDQSVRHNVVRAVNYPATLEPAGMLEREAEGLIFLSNDTELVRSLKRGDNKFEKEYVVTVDKILTSEFLHKISGGNPEPGEDITLHAVTKENSTRFRIVLRPNADHYLKRLCESLGYKVVHLQRIRFGTISVSKMASGHWRTLTQQEIDEMLSIASSKQSRPVKEFKSRSRRLEEKEERELKAKDEKERTGTAPKGKTERATSKSTGQGRTPTKAKPTRDLINPKSREARSSSKNAPGRKGASKSSGGRSNAAPKGPSKRSR